MIKPIETIYNGHRFRSRLEARWAVFFDAAGIEYEYEPQGFELENGTRYLPDFYLPKYGWYAEVKPPREGIENDLQKVCQFIGNGINVLVFLGNIPQKREYPIWHYHAIYFNPLRREPIIGTITISYREGSAYFETDLGVDANSETSARLLFGCLANKTAMLVVKPQNDIDVYGRFNPWCEYLAKENLNALDNAYDSARQARFEFGESGAV